MMKWLSVFLILAVLVAGCSSASEPPEAKLESFKQAQSAIYDAWQATTEQDLQDRLSRGLTDPLLSEQMQQQKAVMMQRLQQNERHGVTNLTFNKLEMVEDGIDVINLSVGEPDFGTPDVAREAGKEAIDKQFTKYTAVPGIVELRKKIAEYLQTKGLTYAADDILVSSGAKQSLYNAFMALCNPGDEVILPAPYWVSYPEMIRLAEAVPVVIETDESTGFKITPEQLERAVTDKTKVLLLNSPSNPTGSVYSPDELEALAAVIRKHDFYVISDEIYEQIVYGVESRSIATYGEDIKARTIVVNGFSKSYAMTGWRVGYLAGDRAVIKAMTSFQSHTTANPTSISQKAALAALDHVDETMVPEFRARRDYVLSRIEAMPLLTCDKPDGAFYVFPNCAATFGKSYKGHAINNCDDFASLLLTEANISLVPGSGFGAPNNFRISYATSRANLEKAMDRLEAFMKEVQ